MLCGTVDRTTRVSPKNLNVELNESMAMSGERVHLLTAINPGRLQGSQTLIESIHLLCGSAILPLTWSAPALADVLWPTPPLSR